MGAAANIYAAAIRTTPSYSTISAVAASAAAGWVAAKTGSLAPEQMLLRQIIVGDRLTLPERAAALGLRPDVLAARARAAHGNVEALAEVATGEKQPPGRSAAGENCGARAYCEAGSNTTCH